MRNPIRMAGDALRQMDDAYANAIGELMGRSPIGAWTGLENMYVQGTSTPLTEIYKGKRDARAAGLSDDELREVMGGLRAAELGAAGRYGIPAAGIGGAGLVANSMMNNGNGYEIDYDSAAHGGNLSPESKQTYIKIHQGLMNDADRNGGYAEQVRAAYAAGEFDYDPALKNHIADVMG